MSAGSWRRSSREGASLHEFDKIEWRDIVRSVRPDISDEQFEADWEAFAQLKRRKRLQ